MDSTEELEPLFDYTRVQPLNFVSLDDDDSDICSVSFPKRRKASKPTVEEEEEDDDDDVKVIDVVKRGGKVDNEDWLPPPPKFSDNVEKQIGEDSTIKELRLKKQELQSLATSAGEVLRAVEESVKRELSSLLQASPDITVKQPSKLANERTKIVVSIQDKNGLQQFRVFKDDRFEQIFQRYAEKVKHDVQSLMFCFDGDKINPTATPDSLGMEDDDIIEVHMKKS